MGSDAETDVMDIIPLEKSYSNPPNTHTHPTDELGISNNNEKSSTKTKFNSKVKFSSEETILTQLPRFNKHEQERKKREKRIENSK